MTVQDAAIRILQFVGMPLHTKEFSIRAIKSGPWQSEGIIPDATVSANFYSDIKIYSDIKKYGDKSAFLKVEPQIFALRGSAEISSDVGSDSVKVKEVS